MCLIAFAWQADEDHPLVVAANRDELFARPTASADWWSDGRRLAGRDLRAGGTWIGVSRDGRFAALTNYRDPSSHKPGAPSRGELVADFLDGDARMLDRIARDARRFNGFSLLAARWGSSTLPAAMWVVSQPGPATPTMVSPGFHGLSNALLDTPWPKVRYATEGTRAALRAATTRDDLIERLLTMLDDRSVAPDEQLPRTGVSPEAERALSATFIRMPGYGTRASTVFIVDRNGHATFVERRSDVDRPVARRCFEFDIALAR